MRRVLLGLFVAIALMFLATPLVFAGAKGSTTIKVTQEITDAYIEGTKIYIVGMLHVTNVGKDPAVITGLNLIVQARLRGGLWTNLNPTVWYTGVPFSIAPGETFDLVFPGNVYLWYDKGTTEWSEYRNVVNVHLQNHSTGDRWFARKLNFEVP